MTDVSTSDILNFKTWYIYFYKKSCVSAETRGKQVQKYKKETRCIFPVCSFFHFVYSSANEDYIKAYTKLRGLICKLYKLLHGKNKRSCNIAHCFSLSYGESGTADYYEKIYKCRSRDKALDSNLDEADDEEGY